MVLMNDGAPALRRLIGLLSGKLEPPPDWDPVLQLASETLTIGTLASTVLGSGLAAQAPEPVRELLVDVLHRTRERNRRLKEQLLELLPALNAAGVEPVVMRGMASLLQEPDDRGRLLADIDLLIPRPVRDAAVHALGGLGYEIFQGFHGPPHAVTLGRGRDVGMADLHTDLQPYSLGIDYDRVAPLCTRTDLPAGTLLIPGPTAALLFHILHDQLHDGDYWRGLIDARHLMDMPAIVSSGVDWPALAGFFPAGSARNAMHVHLTTAKRLLGVDVPQERCGGPWAAIQFRRRMAQLRVPALRTPLTLLTLALDPPQPGPRSSRARPLRRSLRSKVESALRPVNSGKVLLGRERARGSGSQEQ
jgi:hypothetical protein